MSRCSSSRRERARKSDHRSPVTKKPRAEARGYRPESRSDCDLHRHDTRGCPRPLAGRSLRPSGASARSMLTSLRHPWLRSSATPAPGHGQPLAASGLAFDSLDCRSGSSRPEARAEAGATCAPLGHAEAIEQRTHTPQVGRRPHSRRRRACLRPAAVPLGVASFRGQRCYGLGLARDGSTSAVTAGSTKILPSPIRPVRATAVMALTTSSTRASSTQS